LYFFDIIKLILFVILGIIMFVGVVAVFGSLFLVFAGAPLLFCLFLI